MKSSIIIPAYVPPKLSFKFEKFYKPLLQSLLDYTHLHDHEVLIIDNGSIPEVFEFTMKFKEKHGLENLNIRSYNKPLGFTKAANYGMTEASNEIVILMNDDNILLHQPRDFWLNCMFAPFQDPKVGISGPVFKKCEVTEVEFCIAFCVAFRKKMLDEIGLFDPYFNPGFAEEIDLAARAQAYGWKVSPCMGGTQKGDQIRRTKEGYMRCMFPIFHEGSVSVKTLPGWNKTVDDHLKEVICRRKAGYYTKENLENKSKSVIWHTENEKQ